MAAASISNGNTKENGASKVSVPIISTTIGLGNASIKYQKRSLRQLTGLTIVSLLVFHQHFFLTSPKVRAAAVGLIFPGAGFIACGNVFGAVAFILTIVILLPLSLFAWFAAGALAAPILVWSLGIVGAYFLAEEHIFEYGDIVSILIVASIYMYLSRFLSAEEQVNVKKRNLRNDFLPAALLDLESSANPAPPENERELALSSLRALQYVFDQSFLAIDDWTGHTIVDQFQTSALRYQMYEIMYQIGIYQGVYAPNFHGYASQGVRNAIEKSLTKKVMNFWKWESLWGKFTLDWDPVIRDNIMVSGYLLEGVMLYISNTRDMRYSEPGSLTFHVDDNAIYEHDVHSIDKALVSQWKDNPYCLFPCEPNWSFTPCNFQGMTAQVIYDRVFGTNHVEEILPRFRESLLSDFAMTSGSLIPIRSTITGFTIPGMFGSMFDLASATLCRGYFDDLAKQMWSIFKTEVLRYSEDTGQIELLDLAPGDKIDAGNYQASENGSVMLPYIAYTAGEYGDEKLRVAAKDAMERELGIDVTSTGATRLKSGSFLLNMARVRSELLRHEDWKKVVGQGPSKIALAGPILNEVPYPGVLVAKARSHTSFDLELVLYPSADAGAFILGIERLQPHEVYSYGEEEVVADRDGKAVIAVNISGRTEVRLTPKGNTKI